MAYFTTDRLFLIPITMRIRERIKAPRAILRINGMPKFCWDEIASGVMLWAWLRISKFWEISREAKRGRATNTAMTFPNKKSFLIPEGRLR